MTHSENYVRFLKTHPPPKYFFQQWQCVKVASSQISELSKRKSFLERMLGKKNYF
jgi:hypothetical protein